MPLKTSSVLFFQKSCYFFAEKYCSVKEGFACDGHASFGTGLDMTKRGLMRAIITKRYKFARYFSPFFVFF